MPYPRKLTVTKTLFDIGKQGLEIRVRVDGNSLRLMVRKGEQTLRRVFHESELESWMDPDEQMANELATAAYKIEKEGT